MNESRKTIFSFSVLAVALIGLFVTAEFLLGNYWIGFFVLAMVVAVFAAFAAGQDFKRKAEGNPESAEKERGKHRVAFYWITGLLLLWSVFSVIDYLVTRNISEVHRTVVLVPIWLFLLLALGLQLRACRTIQQGAGRNAG